MTDKDIELAVEHSVLEIGELPDVDFQWDDGLEGVHLNIVASTAPRIGFWLVPALAKPPSE
jgi:hypothetical protein